MANRHLARSIVLQTLFEWDFRKAEKRDTNMSEILERNIREYGPGLENHTFMHELLAGVLQKQPKLDEVIEKAAPDWPIDKIALTDRNILRIGLFELLFGDRANVPPKVAINESIELAKGFGGEKSGKFVNGVLGSVYREIGEPGKDDTSKKRRIPNIPYEEMPVEELGGAVVYAKDDKGDIHFALVHDIFGYWTLSKGHVEEGETLNECVIREAKEELGLDITIQQKLGENEYIATQPEEGKIRKQVTYFLAESSFVPVRPPVDKSGLDDVRWFRLEEIPGLTFYNDIVELLTQSIKILNKESDSKKKSKKGNS